MRPLERIGSIKLKLGIVIVLAVGVTAAVSQIGYRLGWPVWLRPLVAGDGRAPPRPGGRQGHDGAAAGDGPGRRGDGTRRLRASRRDDVTRRGGPAGPRLQRHGRRAGEVDRHRRNLIANAAHELRTPLAGLQATLENLSDGVVQASPAILGRLTEQVDRMGRLVHDLLDLSRLDAGVAPMRRDVVHVAALVDGVVRDRAPDVRVAVSVPHELVVVGDPERLRQVVADLVTNAVVHGRGQGVAVGGGRAGDVVTLCVEDHGPGLDPDDLSQVFERFYRGSGSRGVGRGGSGLGLAIAQSIVEQHGGAIHAEANQPSGFRVRVELPAPTPARVDRAMTTGLVPPPSSSRRRMGALPAGRAYGPPPVSTRRVRLPDPDPRASRRFVLGLVVAGGALGALAFGVWVMSVGVALALLILVVAVVVALALPSRRAFAPPCSPWPSCRGSRCGRVRGW